MALPRQPPWTLPQTREQKWQPLVRWSEFGWWEAPMNSPSLCHQVMKTHLYFKGQVCYMSKDFWEIFAPCMYLAKKAGKKKEREEESRLLLPELQRGLSSSVWPSEASLVFDRSLHISLTIPPADVLINIADPQTALWNHSKCTSGAWTHDKNFTRILPLILKKKKRFCFYCCSAQLPFNRFCCLKTYFLFVCAHQGRWENKGMNRTVIIRNWNCRNVSSVVFLHNVKLAFFSDVDWKLAPRIKLVRNPWRG